MDFLELMQRRYTTKKYDENQRVSDQDIEKLKEILRLSPSSINSQPWRFTFISDPALKSELAQHSYFNKEKIEQASHLVVFSVVSDPHFFVQEVKTYLSEGHVQYLQQKIASLPEYEVKHWLTNQVYIALGIFLAACASMGIDATAMGGIDEKQYTQILGDEKYEAVIAVAIGYRSAQDYNQLHLKPKERLSSQKVIVHK